MKLTDLQKIENTPQPTPGMGLALDVNGLIPPSVLAPSPADLNYLQYNASTNRLQYATVTIPAVGYGTSLPGSPANGDEYILVDSTTSPTYQWRLRYNSGSSNADKWEFIGGAPLTGNYIVTLETTTSTTFVDLTTVGPSVTIPRTGVYEFSWGAELHNNTSGDTAVMSLQGGGLTANANDAVMLVSTGANIPQVSASAERVFTITATGTVKAQYAVVTGGTLGATRRWLRVAPVRVS